MSLPETLLEELEVMKSIYCEPGEFHVNVNGVSNVKVIKQMKIQCSSQSCTSTIYLSLTLQLSYPEVPPEIVLTGQDFSDELLMEIQETLENIKHSLVGRPMILDLVMQLQEIILSLVLKGRISWCSCLQQSEKKQETTVIENPLAEQLTGVLWITLLQIDHMRSKTSYIKTSQWTKELRLNGCLIFYERLILLVLQGEVEDIQNFIVQLRTVNIDTDSHGRKCKERMSKVLAEPQRMIISESKRFTNFSIVTLSDWQDVEELFCVHGLQNLFINHISLLKKIPK